MIVETRVVGRRTPFERRPITLPDGPHTLETLLIHLVEGELAAYHERQDRVGVLMVLTAPQIEEGAALGRISAAPQERAARVDPQEAQQTALRAFRDGLYYVFLDDEQLVSLETPLTLRPGSTLLLLRLTALAGG